MNRNHPQPALTLIAAMTALLVFQGCDGDLSGTGSSESAVSLTGNWQTECTEKTYTLPDDTSFDAFSQVSFTFGSQSVVQTLVLGQAGCEFSAADVTSLMKLEYTGRYSLPESGPTAGTLTPINFSIETASVTYGSIAAQFLNACINTSSDRSLCTFPVPTTGLISADTAYTQADLTFSDALPVPGQTVFSIVKLTADDTMQLGQDSPVPLTEGDRPTSFSEDLYSRP